MKREKEQRKTKKEREKLKAKAHAAKQAAREAFLEKDDDAGEKPDPKVSAALKNKDNRTQALNAATILKAPSAKLVTYSKRDANNCVGTLQGLGRGEDAQVVCTQRTGGVAVATRTDLSEYTKDEAETFSTETKGSVSRHLFRVQLK